ncbi:MAG: trypsin-like serine protease, partial [Christensenellaceae bacterium]|nr:trypsin-like serine protease [Christensenellaceae bacterium]
MKKNYLKIIALSLVCVLLGTAVGLNTHRADETAQTVIVTNPFTKAIEEVHGSVVGINNYSDASNNDYGSFSFDFGFGDFRGFGNFQRPTEKEVLYGAGSGVVVSDEGYVLTNYHVVDKNTRLEVVVDEKTYEAELVAYDQIKDLAVLKAKDLKLPAVRLGDSDTLKIGDWAICIGNPISLPGTTTVGVISAIERQISTSSRTDKYGKRTENINSMIQTDAAINSGNSGGGLFNVNGELMGVPTLKYTKSGFSSGAQIDGIGMAIPINEAKPLIEKALKGENVAIKNESTDQPLTGSKPRIGVTISGINPNSTAVIQGIIPMGASIRNVEANSPAEKAG